MGLKKAWIYDNTVPAALAEELSAGGCSTPINTPDGSARFMKKREELESYSLSASGDLALEGAYDWPRLSVASRAHELKTRMKKAHLKGRRSSSLASVSIGEDVRRELEYISGGGGGGMLGANRRTDEKGVCNTNHGGYPSYALCPADVTHRRAVSEPLVIDTVADLLDYLKVSGRPSPPLVPLSSHMPPVGATISLSSASSTPNVLTLYPRGDSDVDSGSDDESCASALLQTPTGSDGGVSESENDERLDENLKEAYSKRSLSRASTKIVQNFVFAVVEGSGCSLEAVRC
ncbi:hypothetical protein M0805_004710 [Coniferiporia weirii]|nr:hypothetical protein M0805_004710 [Coniferiporia weirii]